MACGDLVLSTWLEAQPPGAVLKLSARDAAAPEDLPAWCRLTGHTRFLAGTTSDLLDQRKE